MSGGKISAVGIGPGVPAMLTDQARQALAAAEVVVGYRPYVEQIAFALADQEVVSTGMRGEVERCRRAVALAAAGKRVAVVSSGDAGVYGMAGLLLELLAAAGREDIGFEVIPGITAASLAAAVLGAPLMNDFVVISLSDLLTPREEIRRRLAAVMPTELVCVLYNPRSRSRQELFAETLAGFRAARGPQTLAGLVKNAGRPGQETWVGELAALPVSQVDMVTVVVIGNQATTLLAGRLVTRRGYRLGGS
ncbi:MAG: precorrin-3B C(17)-methyltransferase [Deltaproteobacteria bacterium]|nr:precorrin-3B C(17)-methyltransferase [Deltaproteobacteria bacterium]